MPKLKHYNRGFTLIELLIVIVIISILITLLAVSYTTIQRNSRDTQRKGDLAAVAGVLERFYSDNSAYPVGSNGKISYNTLDCSNATPSEQDWGIGSVECNGTNYTRQLPKDPTGAAEYCYLSLNSNQKYEIYARLEGTNGRNYSGPTPPGCTGTNYNYRITSND